MTQAQTMLSESGLDAMYEYSKDDHAAFVGSDIRQLIGEIRRLRATTTTTQPVTADRLTLAWTKYEQLFGDAPHGTLLQLTALLQLLPAAALPAPQLDAARSIETCDRFGNPP